MKRLVMLAAVLLVGCPKTTVESGSPLKMWTLAVDAMSADLYQEPSFLDPTARAAKLAEACAAGWTPACAPGWSGEGIDRVVSAGKLAEPLCATGDLASCTVSGWALTQDVPGLTTSKAADPATGAARLDAACTGGIARACRDRAELATAGIGGPVDLSRADVLLNQACTGGDAGACARSGAQQLLVDPAGAVPRLTSDCGLGTRPSCVVLGGAMLRGEGTTMDPARGAALLKAACDGGIPQGCTRLAQAYALGDGVALDFRSAGLLFEKSCAAGDGGGCEGLAALVERGNGVPRDAARAISLRREACMHGAASSCAGGDRAEAAYLVTLDTTCAGGDTGACAELGEMYADIKRSVAERERGILLLQRACVAGMSLACNGVAYRYEEGMVTHKDFRLAAEYYDKACALDSMSSCKRVGELYATGNGPVQDRQKAAERFGRVCDTGDREACRERAEQWLQGGLAGTIADGVTRGVAALEKDCSGGDAGACGRIGEIKRDGLVGHPDPRAALVAFGRACSASVDGADPTGQPFCYELAELSFLGNDVSSAASALLGTLGRDCDAGTDMACATLAKLLAGSKGIPKDVTSAAERAKQGCDAKGLNSCGVYGRFFRDGTGVTKDMVEAERLLGQACDGKVFDACADLETIHGKTAPKPKVQAPTIYR